MSVMQTSELNRLWLSNVYLVKPCRRPGIGSCHEDRLMLERTVFALFAAALLTTPLKAMDCPVETRVEGTLEAKEEAIRKARSCKAAYQIMEACAYTASGDTGLGEAVRERCEPEFLPRLSKSLRRVYDQEQRRCTHKYVNKSGTMYVSFSAFCRAESTVKYAAKYGAPAKAKD
jgi:hypothetical protein